MLRLALDATFTEHGSLVLVGGAAIIGKTVMAAHASELLPKGSRDGSVWDQTGGE